MITAIFLNTYQSIPHIQHLCLYFIFRYQLCFLS